jgi:TonB-linked SusC/RagA family outer membrane protein
MKKLFIIALLTLVAPLSLWAQNITVSGVVRSDDGQPVAGAMVTAAGGKAITIADAEGRYSLQVPDTSGSLEFSFLGYQTRQETIAGRSRVDVVMAVDATQVDEVVVVGYGTQRRGSITGSVANVRGSEMIKTKNENPQNMLNGKLPGVRLWQRSAEPGAYAATFDIRGYEGNNGALVIIDGIPRSMSDFQRINPADIEDVSVLKDASGAIYGARGASGVLLVTTKRGRNSDTEVAYNGSFTFQMPSGMPKLVGWEDAMTLYNEMARNMQNPGNYRTFDEAQFAEYRNGTKQATDWNKLMFASWAPQIQHDLSITGGNEKTRYYVSMGYSYQQSFFKSGDLNARKVNLRSNIDTEILPGLKFGLELAGMMDKQNKPWEDSNNIIRRYWAMGATMGAYADPEQTMLSDDNLVLRENPVAFMTADVSGHKIRNKKNFQSAATLTYDFGTILEALKGLSFKAILSYDYEVDNNEDYSKEYQLYHAEGDSYVGAPYASSSPSSQQRNFYDKNKTLGQFTLNYQREFDKHNVSGVVGWEVETDRKDNFYAFQELSFASPYLILGSDNDARVAGMSGNMDDFHEYAWEGLLGRVNYAYDNRYLIEAQFRYDASSKLAAGHRWQFFPSVSLGWRVSEEPFIKNSAIGKIVNQFKLRASYGKLGDENQYYAWMQAYTYPQSGDNPGQGYFNGRVPGMVVNGKFIQGVNVDRLANPSITWATSNTFDIGFDLEMWNGKLGVVFDYFDRRRSGIYAQSATAVPTVVGADAPMVNADKDRQFGMELELSHRHRIGEVNYRVRAMGTITRRMFLTAIGQRAYKNSYDKWRNDNLTNRYQGVQFGWEGDGRFESWDDIWNYGLYLDNGAIIGDYKYKDWNGDGQINGEDKHPYAFDQTPWLNYSLGLDVAWRKFDLSLMFQGTAMGSYSYAEPLRQIWGQSGGGTLDIYLDRWHPVDPNADPWNPSTQWVSGTHGYGNRAPDVDSSFNRVSTAFLRLKSIELGYTIPHIKALDTMSLRVYASAYNLFTITGVKYIDPEHPGDNEGRMYPLNKSVTLGAQLKF